MTRTSTTKALALATALALIGCHSMRFEVGDGASTQAVHDRKSFFLWGLVPTKRVDVGKYCPNGAAAISEETTFVDGLCSFVTLGIWSPRSSVYYCSVEAK